MTGDERVERRAELLPEERAAGSDAPVEQVEALLEASDERTEAPQPLERRTSAETAADGGPAGQSPSGSES